MLESDTDPEYIEQVCNEIGFHPSPKVGDLLVVNPIMPGETDQKKSIVYTQYYPSGTPVGEIAVGTIVGPAKEVSIVDCNGIPTVMARISKNWLPHGSGEITHRERVKPKTEETDKYVVIVSGSTHFMRIYPEDRAYDDAAALGGRKLPHNPEFHSKEDKEKVALAETSLMVGDAHPDSKISLEEVLQKRKDRAKHIADVP